MPEEPKNVFTDFGLKKQEVAPADPNDLTGKRAGISLECWEEIKELSVSIDTRHNQIKALERQIDALVAQGDPQNRQLFDVIKKHHPEVREFEEKSPDNEVVFWHGPKQLEFRKKA